MSPEFIFETSKFGVCDIWALKSTENFIVDIDFELLLSGESGGEIDGPATATLGVFHDSPTIQS